MLIVVDTTYSVTKSSWNPTNFTLFNVLCGWFEFWMLKIEKIPYWRLHIIKTISHCSVFCAWKIRIFNVEDRQIHHKLVNCNWTHIGINTVCYLYTKIFHLRSANEIKVNMLKKVWKVLSNRIVFTNQRFKKC